MDLSASMRVASSGMSAQAVRMRVAAENLANANSTASVLGGDPYRRKTVSFENRLDREMGADLVEIRRIGTDKSQFELRHDPNHPSADEDGMVAYPNVNPLIELMDLREAQRSYEANLASLQQAKSMMHRLIDVLR